MLMRRLKRLILANDGECGNQVFFHSLEQPPYSPKSFSMIANEQSTPWKSHHADSFYAVACHSIPLIAEAGDSDEE